MRVGWVPKASRPSLTLSRNDDALAGAVRSSPLPSGEGGRSGLGLLFLGRFGGLGFFSSGSGRSLFRGGFGLGSRSVLGGFGGGLGFFLGADGGFSGFHLGCSFCFRTVGFALGALGGAFLGLLARLRLVRVVALRPLDLAGQGFVLAQEAGDAVGRLGALGEPFRDAVGLQGDALLLAVARQHRVVRTDALDEFAVAGSVAVSDDDVVVGALLGAAAGQTNLQHFQSLSLVVLFLGREARQTRKAPRKLSAAQTRDAVLKGFHFVGAGFRHLAAAHRLQSRHVGAAAEAASAETAHHGGHLFHALAAAARHGLHHVGHLAVLFEQAVDLLHLDAGAGGDALLAAGVQ